MYFLWARHDHNKIAPCGMIKVFELNLTVLKTKNKTKNRDKKNKNNYKQQQQKRTFWKCDEKTAEATASLTQSISS